MTVLRKYSYRRHKYKKYRIPDKWNVQRLIDEDDVVNCAGCGKLIGWDSAYTSLLIHDDIGIGYLVCKDCQEKEIKHKCKNAVYIRFK